MICTQCGTTVPGGAAACPRCAARPGSAAQGTAGPPQSFRLDPSRWARSDLIAGAGTLVLLVSLFLPWYGVSLLGMGISAEADGLTGHGYLYIVLILCVAIIAYLVMSAGLPEMPGWLPLSHQQRLLVGTGVNAVLVLLAFAIKPGVSSWRFGAFVGIIAAVAAAAPLVIPAARARRATA
jgi:hypothetical protein